SGCDAIHPGYGFLAENPALPRACEEAGLVFIGPSAEAMEALGSKTGSRPLAQSIGYPVLLNAVSGGGGKGMRLVAGDPDFASAWRDASSEALNAFGDPRLYLEKYLEKPRHIE